MPKTQAAPSEDAIAIYWDLDFPSAFTSAAYAACQARASASACGPVVLQRALACETALSCMLPSALKRRHAEPVLVSAVRPLSGWIECLAQDLTRHPEIRCVALASTRGDLAPLQDFIGRCGRRVVVVRDDAGGPIGRRGGRLTRTPRVGA